jgi:DNA (cytosine-5)-methyltransferase 1
MLATRYKEALENIKKHFTDSGYDLYFKLLDANDYKVAQNRKRVFFIGFRKDLNIKFEFPKPFEKKRVLKDVILDLKDSVLPAKEKNYTNGDTCKIPNHEYLLGGFSSIFMSRNRVRSWDEPSFTIQAGGRHAPLHPQAPKMQFVEQNKRIFVPNCEHLYRRLSIRECARIQSFPDSHIFYYKNLTAGYKMVGNAVPPYLAYYLAKEIQNSLANIYSSELTKSINKSIEEKPDTNIRYIPKQPIVAQQIINV